MPTPNRKVLSILFAVLFTVVAGIGMCLNVNGWGFFLGAAFFCALTTFDLFDPR